MGFAKLFDVFNILTLCTKKSHKEGSAYAFVIYLVYILILNLDKAAYLVYNNL